MFKTYCSSLVRGARTTSEHLEHFLFFVEQEIWKPVVGYEGVYEVSNKGRIKSLERIVNAKNRQIHKRESIRNLKINDGYYYVTLAKNSKRETIAVHRIVAMAFIEKPNGKNHIDHINTNRLDNRVENLKWCTRLENARNPITHKKIVNSRKSKEYREKQIRTRKEKGLTIKIGKYSKDGTFIKMYDSISDAAKDAAPIGYKTTSAKSLIAKHRDKSKLVFGFLWKTKMIEPTQ